MKLMKHITIALVLCAIPAMAFGQDVQCEICSHKVSVYMGEGGLIATVDSAEKVTYVATCEGVTRTGELTASADGMVSTLLTTDNGLACHGTDDENEFRLGPIRDGGWYWITDDMNSAVGNLVDEDILDNETTTLTSAGAGVTMTEGEGAVYLKETSSGRVGILPNILPVETMAPAAVNYCSYTGSGEAETANCMLGNGGSMLQVKGPTNVFTGKRSELGANAMVTRPAAAGTTVTVTADLWGNGTGHFTSGTVDNDSTSGTFNPANLGHSGGTRLTATIGAKLGPAGPGEGTDIDADATATGLSFAAASSLGTLTIAPNASYCDPTATPPVNHTATVTFTATLNATEKTQVTPTLTTTPAAAGTAATHVITVVCPSASASMGVELVPENPFPVE